MKSPHRVDQHVGNQVLAGDHMHFVRALRFLKERYQVRRSFQERLGVRQELLPLRRQWRPPPQPAALAIEFHAQPLFEREQPAT